MINTEQYKNLGKESIKDTLNVAWLSQLLVE